MLQGLAMHNLVASASDTAEIDRAGLDVNDDILLLARLLELHVLAPRETKAQMKNASC